MITCLNCGRENPPGSKFCNNCGFPLPSESNLAQSTTEETSEQTGSVNTVTAVETDGYRLSSSSASRKQHQTGLTEDRGGLDGERRVVTILFCDVQDSTAAAERLDPEEWGWIMNNAFTYMIQPVYQYGGIVARLMGDGLLAFFGAPIAHEDDPQRAILAGLAIAEGIKNYSKSVQKRWGFDFDVRIGINTGLVVVGAIGAEHQTEYTAMGDAVNVAARMEQTARPGTVQIGEDTYRLVKTLFEVENQGGSQVKGRAEPVTSYRVIKLKPVPVHPRKVSKPKVGLVGRDQELAVLQSAIEQLANGKGAIIFLIGEAGLGKSRLIYEAKQVWRESQHQDRWYETGSLSYETAIPYAQFQRLLRQGARITPSDSSDVVRNKLNIYMQYFPEAQQDEVFHIFETMLTLERVHDHRPVEGEAFKGLLFDMMMQLTRSWGASAPMVLVLDDLHWADPTSTDLLIHLFQLVDEVPILFLCAMRPDMDTPGWQAVRQAQTRHSDRYQELRLNPLTRDESTQLVQQLAGGPRLSELIYHQILDKTEGNPFYLEEVVFSLKDQDNFSDMPAVALSEAIQIPDSLQTLLLSRIDRLEENTRHTLQLASVIGRTFFYRVLAAIIKTSVALDTQLDTLQKHELIREAADLPEKEYIFRHALIQEAAYNTILLRQRRVFHQQVGKALESLFPDRVEELAPLLAQHFYEATDSERAVHYFKLAGDVAFRLYANAEAVTHYSRAIELLQTLPYSRGQHDALYLQRGRSLELLGRYGDALENYAALELIAQVQGERSSELAALVAQATLYATPTARHDPIRGRQLSERALSLAQELQDHEAEAKALWTLLLLSKFDSTPTEGIRYGEASLAIARKYNLQEQTAFTLNDLAIFGYLDTGDLSRAQAALDEARPLWVEMNNQPMLADNLSSSAIAQYLMGNFDQAFELSDRAMAISQNVGNLWGQAYSLWTVGDIYFERGQISKGIRTMQDCIEVALRAGFVGGIVGMGTTLSNIYAAVGALEKGLNQTRQAADVAKNSLPGWMAWPLSIQARLLLQQGNTELAEATFDQALTSYQGDNIESRLPYMTVSVRLAEGYLALAKGYPDTTRDAMEDFLPYIIRGGMRVFLPDVLRLLAHAQMLLGYEEDAYQNLLRALDTAEALGSLRNQWPTLLAISEIERSRGNELKVQAFRSRANEIIRYIAEHIEEAELRATFLSLANAQDVLN